MVYDKQGSALRVETTLNHVRDIKTDRPKEGDPDGPRACVARRPDSRATTAGHEER